MKRSVVLLAVTAFLVFASTGIAGGDKNRGEIGKGGTYENGCEDQPCFESAPKPDTLGMLSTKTADVEVVLDDLEVEHLVFIREEEKMARDVYRVLYQTWGSPVFANIMASEQAHMDAMANLLSFYGIEDPVTDDAIGVFSDPDIAELFIFLTEWGLISERDAFLVGGYIEEFDILDIWKAYEETDEARIRRVYKNLYEGSYNHLDAFVHNFAILTGDNYEPQLLTDAQFDLVMAFATQAKQAQRPKPRRSR